MYEQVDKSKETQKRGKMKNNNQKVVCQHVSGGKKIQHLPLPDTEITWEDLVAVGKKDFKCSVQKDKQGIFLGPNGAQTYPHFHI